MIRILKKFVIDRSKWLNGKVLKKLEGKASEDHTDLISSLRDEQSGLMCCMGIYAKACGIKKDDLIGKGMPDELVIARIEGAELIEEMIPREDQREIAGDNDSDNVKESLIKERFKDLGIEVTFKGRTADAIKRARKVYYRD